MQQTTLLLRGTDSSAASPADEHSATGFGSADETEPRKRNRNFSLGRSSTSSRDEMNLAEFPLAVLSTRVNPDVKTLEFKDYQRKPNGELIERKWIITGADKFGLPTSTDDDVVLGLIRMTMDQGFRDPKVYFTRYELLKTLRWSTEGRSYSRLIKSLDRLSGVRIRSTNSFYDNTTKSYQTTNFGIIDAYEINDERAARAGEEDSGPRKSFFIWSEVLFDSFKAGFVKKLDLDFYFTLRSAVSRRLYRYLDKHFYYKSAIEMPLTVLAFEKVGISRSHKYVSSIKQQLEPAATELVERGFLSGYEFSGSGTAATVRFIAKKIFAQSPEPQGRQDRAPIDAAEDRRSAAPQDRAAVGRGRAQPRAVEVVPEGNVPDRSITQQLQRELVNRGLGAGQVERLLRDKTDAEYEKIAAIIRYFDTLKARNDPKISRSPVGFLYRAIEGLHRFVLPDAAPTAGPRPELKLVNFSEGQGDNRSSALERERYKEFIERELADFRAQLDGQELSELRASIEKKVAFLRPILNSDRFQEAVEGCLREELLKLAQLPTFELWRRKKTAT